jgi:tRNA_anti-like
MKRKTIQYSFFVILIIIAGSAFFTFKEYNRKRKDIAEEPAAYSLGSAEFIAAFATNEKAANQKYLDKVVVISGTVKSADKDEQGDYTVVLGDAASMSSVRCSMDSTHNNEAAGLLPGAMLKVKGLCTGFNSDELLGSDVILSRCSIQKK